MQTSTEQPAKTIAKEAVGLSKENSSSFANMKYDNRGEVFKMCETLAAINNIQYHLKTKEKTLSSKEVQLLKQELEARHLNYLKALDRYELSEAKEKTKTKTIQKR